MKSFKTIITILIFTLMLSSCGIDPGEINVVSREEGSGTRTAFVELLGVMQEDTDGREKDKTTLEASVVNKTDVMMSTISGDKNAIGYISLGSLNDSVKELAIAGVYPSAETIQQEAYPLARAFYVVTTKEDNPLITDFLSFVLSTKGQKVVEDGYVPITPTPNEYKGASHLKGKITIAGSSSVTPVMEKLAEAYNVINPDVIIEIQMSDSTAGVNATIEGNCQIGMLSREPKASELLHLTPTPIALDGIVIVVNPENPVDNLSVAQAREIFTGEINNWNKVLPLK